MAKMTRREYAQLYGPTKGDGVRLGDTSLIAEIEPGRNTEVEAARQAGVGRQTVRRWRGQTY